MNILFLTVDSLRADRTSLFGHSRNTTPFLADFATDAFEFRRAYTNGRNTSAAFPAVHTSTHQRYYEGIGISESGTPTIAEILRANGSQTFAIHTNELISRDYNYDRGFDVYRDARNVSSESDKISWRAKVHDLISDTFVFEIVKRAHFLSTEYLGVKIFDTADAVSGFEDQLVEWTTNADDDWFVWAHYMNPHHPYEPSAACQEALGMDSIPRREATKLSRKMRLHPEEVTPEERDTLRGLYDASVLSWDREFEDVYRALEDAGELDDTLVVVTADHGELLGEDGRYGHPPVLNQELLRIPLLFRGPVDEGMSDAQVSLLDLATSVLSLAECPIPDAYEGRKLFESNGEFLKPESRPIISDTGGTDTGQICCINGARKVIYDIQNNDWESFTLSGDQLREDVSVDPHDDLRQHVEDFIDRTALHRQDAADVSEENLREDLAALGYLEE